MNGVHDQSGSNLLNGNGKGGPKPNGLKSIHTKIHNGNNKPKLAALKDFGEGLGLDSPGGSGDEHATKNGMFTDRSKDKSLVKKGTNPFAKKKWE